MAKQVHVAACAHVRACTPVHFCVRVCVRMRACACMCASSQFSIAHDQCMFACLHPTLCTLCTWCMCVHACVCVFARVRAALSLPATGASKPLKLRTSCRYSAALCATSCWPWLCIRATWPRPDVTRAPGASSAPNDMDACVRMCACVYVHVYVPARVCHLEGSGRLFNRSGAGRGPAPSTGRQHCPAHRLPANTRTVLQHRLLE